MVPGVLGEGHHPQAGASALVAADDGLAVVADGAVDLCEGYRTFGHIVTTENNECEARQSITWAAWALARRSGGSRVQVCVDCTFSPLGRRAMRGTAARTMLVAGASVVRKWFVAPESRMAHHLLVAASTLIVLRRMEAARA